MALNTDKPVKLYYSIKEVAEMIGVNESTLRYWEKEFTFIKPKVLPIRCVNIQRRILSRLR